MPSPFLPHFSGVSLTCHRRPATNCPARFVRGIGEYPPRPISSRWHSVFKVQAQLGTLCVSPSTASCTRNILRPLWLRQRFQANQACRRLQASTGLIFSFVRVILRTRTAYKSYDVWGRASEDLCWFRCSKHWTDCKRSFFIWTALEDFSTAF